MSEQCPQDCRPQEASDAEVVGSVARLVVQLAPRLTEPTHKPGNDPLAHGTEGRAPDARLQPNESAVVDAYGKIQLCGKGWPECTAAEKAIVILVEDGLKADQAVVVATTESLAPTAAAAKQFMDSLVRRVFGIEDAQVRALLVRVLLELRQADQ